MRSDFIFSTSVQGYLHIAKNRPCEDNSASYSDPEKGYAIAVVCDGHGSSSCFRSQYGSKFAVEAAVDNLRKFADHYLVQKEDGTYAPSEEFLRNIANEKSSRLMIKRLTDLIITDWYTKVTNDLAENEITEEELSAIDPDDAELYRNNRNTEHIYGTTLIAGLLMGDYLVLIHQGDGRCEVIYDDGTCDQPVPWDERCYDVYTTSMCDADVSTRFRHKIINAVDSRVAAVFMCSDGVEDSFRTMDGTHDFFMRLCRNIVDDKDGFVTYLEEYLPVFSQTGSGDDISVSGIVDIPHIKELYNYFKSRNESYELEQNLITVQAKLNSMTRKHGLLRSRLETAEREFNGMIKLYFDEKEKTKQMRERFRWMTPSFSFPQNCFDVPIYETVTAENPPVPEEENDPLRVLDELGYSYASKYAHERYEQMRLNRSGGRETIYDSALRQINEQQDRTDKVLAALKVKAGAFENAAKEFAEYDEKYREQETARAEYQKRIDDLNA